MNRTAYLSSCVGLLIIGCDGASLPSAEKVTVFGNPGLGPGAFAYPRALARTSDGRIYVVDKSSRIQRFTADGTYETSWKTPESAAGKPVGLSVHPDGRVFVPDTHYHRVLVYDSEGRELARFGEYGDGDGQFLLPTDVAFDSAGKIYVAEYGGNDRVTRWSGEFQFERVIIGGDSDEQQMRRPAAILIDAEQALWVADACNHRILQFNLDGVLLTSFGSMGRDAGQLRYPYDLDMDSDGHLVVCEYGNHRIQWFDRKGRSLRVWGEPGRDVGQLNSPWAVVCGLDGQVYVLDSLNARVQIIAW